MEKIKLENNLIELVPSKYERPKSYINFDIKEKNTDKIILEMYTEAESLIDGNLKIRCKYFEDETSSDCFESAIKLVIQFCFFSMPINKVYYEVLENEKNVIKSLLKTNFKVEADLKGDVYREGKYLDRIIMACYKDSEGR